MDSQLQKEANGEQYLDQHTTPPLDLITKVKDYVNKTVQTLVTL